MTMCLNKSLLVNHSEHPVEVASGTNLASLPSTIPTNPSLLNTCPTIKKCQTNQTTIDPSCPTRCLETVALPRHLEELTKFSMVVPTIPIRHQKQHIVVPFRGTWTHLLATPPIQPAVSLTSTLLRDTAVIPQLEGCLP